MTGIFQGVRIVELAQYVFVPAASVLMADQGAEVIKIETIGKGDPYRTLKVGDGRETSSANLSMEQNNRGKKSVSLDLKKPEGRNALVRLLHTADVFLTSLRPKALKSLQLDVDDVKAINPRLIYARGNGMGFRGAEADKAGYDASAYWARGGFASLLTPAEAHSPIRSRPAIGDHSSAVSLAMGIASALFHRERTGEAITVETSLLANAVWTLSSDVVVSSATESYDAHAMTTQADRFPLMRPYRTADDRWIQLMLLAPDAYWGPLCTMLGMDAYRDDPLFATSELRIANGAQLSRIIGDRISARPWTGGWQPIFEAWNAPRELVKTIHEVSQDPQVLANDALFDLQVEDGTAVRVVAGPVCFDGRAAPREPVRSPNLGEHTDAILTEIGYSDADVRRLRQEAAVQ